MFNDDIKETILSDSIASFALSSPGGATIHPVAGPHVQRKSPLYRFDWKAKVIMACTIAAAFEVVIVLFMVLYWGQIRWLLRKFPCPCVGLAFVAINCYKMEVV